MGGFHDQRAHIPANGHAGGLLHIPLGRLRSEHRVLNVPCQLSCRHRAPPTRGVGHKSPNGVVRSSNRHRNSLSTPTTPSIAATHRSTSACSERRSTSPCR